MIFKFSGHKWDREIRAYLDGKEVEMYYPDVRKWKQVQCLNKFDCRFDIRIKPEPKPDVVLYSIVGQLINGIGSNVKYIFDGETRELKSVEIVK
jgi:hypothetical protein